jgi:hypothetical protein
MLRLRPAGYAQHERVFAAFFSFSVRPERTLSLSKGKSKGERGSATYPSSTFQRGSLHERPLREQSAALFLERLPM